MAEKVVASPAAPSNGSGPASDKGYASNWTEFSEADFGGGFTLPVRLDFLNDTSSG